MKKILKNLLS